MNTLTRPINGIPVLFNARSGALRRHIRRALAIVLAIGLVTTIVYGEAWVLNEAPRATMECAVASSVARALDGDFSPI